MVDFLTRLAARALGLAPAVRPRLRARFEAPADLMDSIETTGLVETRDSIAATDSIETPHSTEQDDWVDRQRTRLVPAGEPGNQRGQAAQRAARVPDALLATRAAASERSAVLEPASPSVGAEQPARLDEPVFPVMASDPIEPSGPIVAVVREAPAALSGARLGAAPVVHEAESVPTPVSIPPVQRIAAETRLAAPTQPSARYAEPAPADERPEGPIVRVSIGRIEVRAVTAPTPALRPKPGRHTAGPSLEEYLRERGGGRR